MARKPSFHLPKDRCVEVVKPKRVFDSAFGFRYKQVGKGTILMLGCPKGKVTTRPGPCKQRKGKRVCRRIAICEVGTTAHAMIRPSKGKACPTGQKRVF